jgi:hypothetical protein
MAARYQWLGLKEGERSRAVQRKFWFWKARRPESKPLSPFDVMTLQLSGRAERFEFPLGSEVVPVGFAPDRPPEFSLCKRVLPDGRNIYYILTGFFQNGAYYPGAHPTLVDGRRLEPGTWYGLTDGDVITVGMTSLVFHAAPNPFSPPARSFLERLHRASLNLEVKQDPSALEILNKLLEALNRGEWINALRLLADLPSISIILMTTPSSKGVIGDHWNHSHYGEAVDQLVELVCKGIGDGTIAGVSQEEARLLGQKAKRPIRKEGKKPDLSDRLKEAGCPQPKDPVSSLKFLLEHPRYRPLNFKGEGDELTLDFEPDYEKLISDTVSYGQRNTQLLRKHGFTLFGKRSKFPLAEAFWGEHFTKTSFREEHPFVMLKELIFPDILRNWEEKDPLALPGYREAVCELGQASLRLKSEGKLDEGALLEIPDLPVPSLLGKELTRLIQSPGFEEQLSEMIRRGKEDAGPLREREIQEAESRSGFSPKGTMHYLYSRQIKGGKQISESLPPDFKFDLGEEAKKNGAGNWIYAGTFFESDRELGRFYFAVRPEHAANFWNEVKEIFEKAAESGREFQAKISTDPKRFSAGDGALLYFRPQDQLYFRIQALKVIEAHPEWFHETRPIFTARIRDLKGEFVRGLSFGQDPRIPGASYNSNNASALQKAVRRVRFWTLMGAIVPQEKILQFMADELHRHGIDIAHPAFQRGQSGRHPGIIVFEDLFKVSDQV